MKFLSALSVSVVVCSIAGAQSLPKKKVESKSLPATAAASETKTSTESSGGFKFKTEEGNTGSAKPTVNFHVPSTDEEKNRITADPVNEIFNDSPYKIAIGYPKWDFSFSFNPTNYAFTQKLSSGFSPNMSALSVSAFSFLTRLNVDLSQFWEAEYSQFDAKSNAQTGANLSVLSTTTVPSSIMVRGFYCWIGTMSARRLCVGGEMGSDSAPTLQFVGTSSLELTKVTDYMIGPAVIYQSPLSERLNLHAKLGFLYGTAVGQNSTLAIKSDSKIVTELGLKGALNDRHGYSVLFDYSLRTTKFEGYQGPNLTSWDLSAGNMAAKLAYVYSL